MTVLTPGSLGSLSIAELCAAKLDGELYALGDGYCELDEPERPELRAQSVLAHRSPRIIAELGTAAWIWGATPVRPTTHELCAAHASRSRPSERSTIAVREVRFAPDDVAELAGMKVTTPLRTCVDLARFREPFAAADAAIVRELAALGGFGVEQCSELMNRGANLHGKRRAITRLQSVL